MIPFKEYIFEIQLLLNIFMITAIVILCFLYLKLSIKKKEKPFVEKIEYLCKNLKVLIEESGNSSENIQKKIDEFKSHYDKYLSEIEKRTGDLKDAIEKLESSDNVMAGLKERDAHAKIKRLLSEGHNIDSISKILKISKGEVELINKLKS